MHSYARHAGSSFFRGRDDFPEVFSVRFREVIHDSVFRIIENSAAVQRPVPAARCFQAEHADIRKFCPIRNLSSFPGDQKAVTPQAALHLFQRCLPVISEFFCHLFRRKPGQHGKNGLSALQVGRFTDVFYFSSILGHFLSPVSVQKSQSPDRFRVSYFPAVLLFDLLFLFFLQNTIFPQETPASSRNRKGKIFSCPLACSMIE